MPEIGVVVMDLKSKKVHFAQKYDKNKITEVVWPDTCTNKGEKVDHTEDKKHHASEQRKNLSAMKSNKVQCKFVLPEFDEKNQQQQVYLIFPDVRKVAHEVENTFDTSTI